MDPSLDPKDEPWSNLHPWRWLIEEIKLLIQQCQRPLQLTLYPFEPVPMESYCN
jgi:hypothetical protein